jgi:thymidylate kinase
MNNYKKIFLIEGVDCSGKDYFDEFMQKKFKYKILFLIRGILSNIVYNIYYDRNIKDVPTLRKKMYKMLQEDFCILYLSVDSAILDKRFSERGDEVHKKISSIFKIRDIYGKEVKKIKKKYPKSLIILNNNSIDDLDINYNKIQEYLELC